MVGASSRTTFKARRRAAFVCLGLLTAATLPLYAPGLSTSSAQPEQPTREARAGDYLLVPTGLIKELWPKPKWDFSIEHVHGGHFESLAESNIEADLNGQRARVEKGSLEMVGNRARSFVIMVDRSGSMDNKTVGLNKLHAARESLKTFIKSFSRGDSAVIGSFAADQTWVQELTSRQEDLLGAAERIVVDPNPKAPRLTHLYAAVKAAIEKAAADKVENIIVVSDGMERPAVGMPCDSPEYLSYKLGQEREIERLAKDAQLRIHTIPIGVRDDGPQLPTREKCGNYDLVDYGTLKAMTDGGADGGLCEHVDVEILKAASQRTERTFEELLEERLESILRDIKKRAGYTYSLRFNLPPDEARRDGRLNIVVRVAEGSMSHELRVHYPYHWPEGAQHPKLGAAVIFAPVLVAVLDPAVRPVQRVGIYLWLLLGLFALALIPPAAGQLGARRRLWRARKMIVSVGRNSPLLRRECASEGDKYGGRYLFREGDHVIICSVCETPHHLICWRWGNFRCMRQGCTNEMPIPPDVLEKYGLN